MSKLKNKITETTVREPTYCSPASLLKYNSDDSISSVPNTFSVNEEYNIGEIGSRPSKNRTDMSG